MKPDDGFITNEKAVLVRFIRVVKFIYFKTKALASTSAFFTVIEVGVKQLPCECENLSHCLVSFELIHNYLSLCIPQLL